MTSNSILISESVSTEALAAFGARVAKVLSHASLGAGASPFCLWLTGDLGAGKTTLTGHILRALGLTDAMPVTSPTYTYVNEYRIGPLWYAHLDLYRAGPLLELEELGIVDARHYAGFFVEWPAVVPKNPAIAPTHLLTIGCGTTPGDRLMTLSRPS